MLDNCVGVCKPESISGASTSFDSVIGSIDNQPTPTDLNNEPTSEYEEGNKLAIGSDPKSTEGSRTSSVLDSEDLGLIEGILSNFYEDDEDKRNSTLTQWIPFTKKPLILKSWHLLMKVIAQEPRFLMG